MSDRSESSTPNPRRKRAAATTDDRSAVAGTLASEAIPAVDPHAVAAAVERLRALGRTLGGADAPLPNGLEPIGIVRIGPA